MSSTVSIFSAFSWLESDSKFYADQNVPSKKIELNSPRMPGTLVDVFASVF
jgi:hypothetical protein